jgi:hypothetical protein
MHVLSVLHIHLHGGTQFPRAQVTKYDFIHDGEFNPCNVDCSKRVVRPVDFVFERYGDSESLATSKQHICCLEIHYIFRLQRWEGATGLVELLDNWCGRQRIGCRKVFLCRIWLIECWLGVLLVGDTAYGKGKRFRA